MSTERIDVEALRGHTPGPLEVVHDHPQNACCSVVLRDRPLTEVATLYSSPSSAKEPVGGVWPNDPEREANARLFAAAPALLAEVIERRARDAAVAWQPIETAPSDVPLLLFCPDRGAANPERIELREFRNTRGGHEHAWATHWMPLPEPPAAIQGSQP